MGRANGVAAHVLHRADLANERRLVDSGAQGSEVVVQAHALDLARHAVELETVILCHTHGAYAHLLTCLVDDLLVAVETCHERVEIRLLGRPQLRILDIEAEHGVTLGIEVAITLLCHHLAVGTKEQCLHGERLVHTLNVAAHAHHGFAVANALCAEPAAPRVEMSLIGGGDKRHRTIQAATRIPSRALLAVVQAHADLVFSFLKIGACVDTEGVIAIGPMACQLAVDVDMRVGHGAVKLEHGGLWHALQVDRGLIEAAADPWQGA